MFVPKVAHRYRGSSVLYATFSLWGHLIEDVDENDSVIPQHKALMEGLVESETLSARMKDESRRKRYPFLSALLVVTTSFLSKMRFSLQSKKEHPDADFLDEVFPVCVAKALREGRKIEPESRDCVTIFFSDIVGFTKIASLLSPMKVSDMLDRLYLLFDMLSLKHDVFKVETIGDAYMAATNLVKDQDDHVKRIAEFAIDAVRAANETMIDVDDPSKGFVKIRVGFHSGPVVANVVGSRCRRYSLFGDSVNTAARMESTSKKNRIQCSDQSAGLLMMDHPEIRLVPRGLINVKGKGEIRTFWVNEVDNDPASDTHVPRSNEKPRKSSKKRMSHKLFITEEPKGASTKRFSSLHQSEDASSKSLSSLLNPPKDASTRSFSSSSSSTFSSLQ